MNDQLITVTRELPNVEEEAVFWRSLGVVLGAAMLAAKQNDTALMWTSGHIDYVETFIKKHMPSNFHKEGK